MNAAMGGRTDLLRMSLPGKAFLAGEYLALVGGTALTVAIEPRFVLDVARVGTKELNPFHPLSPAGLFWHKYQNFFSQFKFIWQDPHHSAGGFGGSTAEFAFLHSLWQLQDSIWAALQPQFDLQMMLQDYQKMAVTGGRFLPSGADLIGQMQGGLTLFNRHQGFIKRFNWNFPDLGFVLAKTNTKVKTHEHIAQLSEFNFSGLAANMSLVENALASTDQEGFVTAIHQYSQELQRLNFVADSTTSLLDQLEALPILAKKGCGALGADVILVLFKKRDGHKNRIMDFLKQKGLAIAATEESISEGVQIENLSVAQVENSL